MRSLVTYTLKNIISVWTRLIAFHLECTPGSTPRLVYLVTPHRASHRIWSRTDLRFFSNSGIPQGKKKFKNPYSSPTFSLYRQEHLSPDRRNNIPGHPSGLASALEAELRAAGAETAGCPSLVSVLLHAFWVTNVYLETCHPEWKLHSHSSLS